MSNLITAQEMEEITGAKVGAKQCDVLRQNGIRFTKRADGRPSLSWEAYNRQLSAQASNDNIVHLSGPRLESV